jgi:hypothetical protein
MMQACIEYSFTPKLDKDWAIVLPQLKIGTLASPLVHVDVNTPVSLSKASMYMLIVTMFSSQLWEQLTDVIGTCSASTSPSALVDTMWATVTDRTYHLSQTIDATKHLLQKQSVVAI